MRELRLLLLAVLVPVVGWNLVPLPQASGRPADAAGEVRRVFTLAFDQSRSVEDSVRYIEDGKAIRTKMDNVRRARVDTVRIHANRAEVDFELVNPSGESLGRVLPFGVVVPDGGRWTVSRHTICAVALVAGATPCPGMSPTEDWRQYWMGERVNRQVLTDGMRVVLPLTFLDGIRRSSCCRPELTRAVDTSPDRRCSNSATAACPSVRATGHAGLPSSLGIAASPSTMRATSTSRPTIGRCAYMPRTCPSATVPSSPATSTSAPPAMGSFLWVAIGQ